MNCRPGDLAIIVRADSEPESVDLGKIVRIIGPGESYVCDGDSRHYWECDTLGASLVVEVVNGIYAKWPPTETVDISDDCLRPIRPDEGKDEILRLVGKPEESLA